MNWLESGTGFTGYCSRVGWGMVCKSDYVQASGWRMRVIEFVLCGYFKVAVEVCAGLSHNS